MSKGNVQSQRVESAKPAPGVGKDHPADIQMEIGRAFDVASAIEKAIRAECGESLYQFLARLTPDIFQGVDLQIYRRFDYMVRYKEDIDCLNLLVFWRTNSSMPHSFHISVGKMYERSPELVRAYECLQQAGFEISDFDSESTEVSTGFQSFLTMSVSVLANALHSVLTESWKVTRKEDIVCYLQYRSETVFTEDGEPEFQGRKLTNERDIANCLKRISLHEPKLVSLTLADQDLNELVEVTRPTTDSFAFTMRARKMTNSQIAEIEATFSNYSFAPIAAPYALGDDTKILCYRGQGSLDSVETLICRVLSAQQRTLESGDVFAQLHVPFI